MCLSKGRPYDVYVGADVFGRGCRGGGGYNTKEVRGNFRVGGLSRFPIIERFLCKCWFATICNLLIAGSKSSTEPWPVSGIVRAWMGVRKSKQE